MMPQQIYLTTSTRSSPSPSPPDSPTLIHPHNDLSQNASSQVRRRGRNGVQPGLTPIRPTVDYSTTGSYLGGESTVDNDTTTDGDAYVNPLLGRLGRTSTASTSQLKSTANRPRTDSPDGRNRTLHERRAALPHRRESPHPPSVASRSKGPIALSPRYTFLFPETILIGPLSIDARQAAEHALLNVAFLLAAWRLVNTGEVSVAHVLLCIMACSFIYEYGWSVVKLFKSFVMETPSHTKPGSSERVPRRTRIAVTPQRGYVWMTDEKNYRECTDNGETTAALLGPLIAASGLYTSMLPPSSLPFTKSWYMEPALPLLGRGSLNQAQATVGARRALVQCMSLNTLLLFAHMYAANNLRSWPSPENTPHQGRRIVLFVLFSACLTFASLGFYEASKAAGWTFLNEISSFDLICSTFFFQTSLYVMIRMARRAFTLGETRDIQAVATDLLDAADKHVPTLSRNGRRKFFHALAVLMFVPGICWDPAFSHLSLSLAFSLFTFAEYIRYFAIYPFGAAVHVFLAEFLDEKDGGTAILSHFYLLTGCAVPLWLESASRVLGLAGVIVLGVGDALASIVGRKIGFSRWFPSSNKTIEGTAAFAASVFIFNWIIAAQEFPSIHLAHLACAVVMTALLEAVSKQNDNLTIPLYMWCMLVLLPVGRVS
ncbi:hypothetical protein FRC12_014248 [Ceratobasidium sp. 428]|nr:hypothetical protein FRC12_014248 [Ceratobasidium sp. 428]